MAGTPNSTIDTAKYDRQLRLWGEEGQARLEAAHICLINGTAIGTETFKNLVLPGIGHFTIVDGGKVTEADTGNNFFVTLDSVGKSRAAVVTELLWELNPLVKSGTAVEKDPVALIDNEPDFFKKFAAVVSTGLTESANRKLGKICYEHNIPMLVLKAYGFLGYLRTVYREHTVVETKPDNPFQDLRLCEPFAELSAFAASIDMDELRADTASARHGHVPLIVILLKALAHWKATHDNHFPTSRQEKDQFKKGILAMARDLDKETNFQDAVDLAYKAWTPTKPPSNIMEILNDAAATNLTATSSSFWVIAHAVKQFVDEHHTLPLVGSIPDMTSDTQSYIALQNLYNTKAAHDAAQVHGKVQASLTRLGRNPATITLDEVKNFCKNTYSLLVVRTSTLEQEDSKAAATIADKLTDPTSNAQLYIAFRAVDKFFEAHKRYPGSHDDKIAADTAALDAVIQDLLKAWQAPADSMQDWAAELTRFGGAELHNIAAFMGGIAAQEVLKAITKMYVPVNNTYLFNGMKTTSASLQL